MKIRPNLKKVLYNTDRKSGKTGGIAHEFFGDAECKEMKIATLYHPRCGKNICAQG